MQTTTTVSMVRALYQGLASSASSFLSELNEITARLMNSDLWVGCTDEVLFDASSRPYIVLPRQFVSVLGFDRRNVAMPVFSNFHQYIEMGIGWQDPSEMNMAGLIDDAFVVTQIIPEGTFYLRVKPSLALDSNKSIRFFGKDSNGFPVFQSGVEGIPLTTAVPSSTTAQSFTTIEGIIAPIMTGYWTLWTVDVTTGAETQVGSYAPGDTIPQFRKYKVGIRGDSTDIIRCFCRRQWQPVFAETDFVFPGCMPAIKLGFKALQLEDADKYGSDNTPNADDQWARSEAELDKELAVYRGYSVPSLRIFGGPYPRHNQLVN